MDDTRLNDEALVQLRNALPPVDILNKLADVDPASMKEMPEGEQVEE